VNELTIGSGMPPEDYLLELVATDKKNNRRNEGVASQNISFTVAEKSE